VGGVTAQRHWDSVARHRALELAEHQLVRTPRVAVVLDRFVAWPSGVAILVLVVQHQAVTRRRSNATG
jgi:hypothetical protein